MGGTTEIRMPKYPECWTTCGDCAAGEVYVQSVLVAPGDRVAREDTLIVLETGKVALDIPCPRAGVVVEVRVREGDRPEEGEVIAVVEGQETPEGG